MAALATDRNTEKRYLTREVVLKLKAGAKVFKGGMVAVEGASGWAVAAGDTAGHQVVGVAKATVDNTGGANGAKSVIVEKGAFKVGNGTTAVAQAHIGDNVHVEDDQTVRSAGSTNSIVAGVVDQIDSDGVWIFIA